MVDYMGPVIPGPRGDEYRSNMQKLEEAKIAAARRRLGNYDPRWLLPDDSMRKLASSNEEYRREIEKYAEALKQSQTKWQKEAGEIIHGILKLGDNAAELYEAFQEYPFSDNFKDYRQDNAEAANKRDNRICLINQAIALYYRNALQDLDKVKITNKPEFKEAQHFLNTLKAKISERTALDETLKECEVQSRLAQFQIAHSQKRDREGRDHSNYIQGLPDGIGRESRLQGQLKAGHVKDYSEQAEERAKELENVLAHVEKHRQDTEAKIGAYLSQVSKRANAVAESTARQHDITAKHAESGVRALTAALLTARARNRSTATPIGNTTYKDIAGRIIAVTATIADNTAIANLAILSGQAETQARGAKIRAREAETRAREAEIRAREAEIRARIAKTYNNNAIRDSIPKDVEKYCNNIAKMEKQIVENAYLIESNETNIEEILLFINFNILVMQNIINTAGGVGALTPGDRKNLQELANEIEEAEAFKNSALAFVVQATRTEQVLLTDLRNELQKELDALGQEHASAREIRRLALLDRPHLYTLVTQQRTLQEILRGRAATAIAAAVPGLIERERDMSQIAERIEQAISDRQHDIGGAAGLKSIARACRRTVAECRTTFQDALEDVRDTERLAAEVLKRNAIHMELDITGDAEQAIERLQKIKDNFAAQDEEGLEKRSKGHLFIDPKVGKFTMNGVWIGVRELDGWELHDPAHPGQTRVRYRPDITSVTINRLSRDAGKDEKYRIDTKRLLQQDFIGEGYHAILAIPGNDFTTGRHEGIAIICNRAKNPIYV